MSTAQPRDLLQRASEAQPVDDKQLAPHLRCSSCRQPLYNAFQTSHGCRLCHLCVTKLPVDTKVLCPGSTEACRDEEEEIHVSQNSVIPDLATRREVGRLKVNCPNRSSGCRQQLKWKEVESHLAACDYEPVACDQCGEFVQKRQLQDHRRRECRQRPVQCEDCGQQVVLSDMKSKHRNLQSAACCPKFRAACPHCGDKQKQLDRSGYLRHLAECPERPVACRFAHLGCEFTGRKSQLQPHCRSCVDLHLELLDKQMRRLGSSPAAPSPPSADARTQSSSEVSAELLALQKQFDTMYDMFKRLQVNAAAWANTTIELQLMSEKLGGFGEMRSLLKGLEAREASSGRPDAAAAAAAAAAAQRAASSSSGGGGGGEAAQLNRRLDELQTQLQHAEASSYDGRTVWRVELPTQEKRRPTAARSPPFYSRRFGHKYGLRLFVEADAAKDPQLVAELLLLSGEFDDTLEWPHVADVTFRLVDRRDRRQDVVKTARLDTGGRRPGASDESSVSCGATQLASLKEAAAESGGRFLKENCLLLAVQVSPSRKLR